MSTTLLNISITTLGLIGTLAAFGGKTWFEDNATGKIQITRRGYLSLFSLLATFALGITKEVRNNNVIDKKDDRITALMDSLRKVQIHLSSYQAILNELKSESALQPQLSMTQALDVRGKWDAPNTLYSGTIIDFYSASPSSNLKIRYGSAGSGYTETEIRTDAVFNSGGPYRVPIAGKSGEPLQWSLMGNWAGKIFVYSSPMSRSTARSHEAADGVSQPR